MTAPGVLLAVLVALLVAVRSSSAHPIHTTLTEIGKHPGGPLTVRIRAFADDFSVAAARLAGAHPLSGHVVSDEAAAQYVARHVRLEDAAGGAVGLSLVGQRRQGDVVFLELRAVSGHTPTRLRMQNVMLFELHSDQVNIVQVAGSRGGRTILFTRGDGMKSVEF